MRRTAHALAATLAAALSAAWLGCVDAPGPRPRGDDPSGAAAEAEAEAGATAAAAGRGSPETFDVASWNVEWFGSPLEGPADEARQFRNARDVIRGADMDVWGLAEIVSADAFGALASQLPGYAGLLADDPAVAGGGAFYRDDEQKPGLLYKRSVATLVGARLILTERDFDFAGRPPLQAVLRVTLAGRTETVVVIVVHAKCCGGPDDLRRRRNAAGALKRYLDSAPAGLSVWVIGDFNDDIDASIAPGNPSPYAAFASDRARYRFATAALTAAGEGTTVGSRETIDHHLVTVAAAARLVPGSAEVFRADRFVEDFGATTSDHYPVFSRYAWGAPALAGVAGGRPAAGGDDGGGGGGRAARDDDGGGGGECGAARPAPGPLRYATGRARSRPTPCPRGRRRRSRTARPLAPRLAPRPGPRRRGPARRGVGRFGRPAPWAPCRGAPRATSAVRCPGDGPRGGRVPRARGAGLRRGGGRSPGRRPHSPERRRAACAFRAPRCAPCARCASRARARAPTPPAPAVRGTGRCPPPRSGGRRLPGRNEV